MNNTEIVQIDPIDAQVIEMWLHGRSEHTQKAYRSDVQKLLSFTGKSLQHTTLLDLQSFSDSLQGLSEASRARILNAVKSLFSFASKTFPEHFQVNVGVALRLPAVPNKLAQRILTEEQVILLIASTRDNPRNHAMLRLMYHCGLRVSEVVNLTWSDLVERSDGGQVTIFGKGGKTRNVLVSATMWDELVALGGFDREGYVFRSRKGQGQLDERQVERIILDAAHKAGIKGNVSPHWLRHAHASHSLDNGANINLVRDTLGHASLTTTSKYTHARPNASSSQFLKV